MFPIGGQFEPSGSNPTPARPAPNEEQPQASEVFQCTIENNPASGCQANQPEHTLSTSIAPSTEENSLDPRASELYHAALQYNSKGSNPLLVRRSGCLCSLSSCSLIGIRC
jgi:hypothetical protein